MVVKVVQITCLRSLSPKEKRVLMISELVSFMNVNTITRLILNEEYLSTN